MIGTDKAKYINGFTLGYSVSAKNVRESDYHCENDYEIMYVRSVERQAFVKNRSYILKSGQLLFINKNELHKTRMITEKYERFVINFGDEYILPRVKGAINVLFEHRIYAPPKLAVTDKLFFSLFSEWEKLRGGDVLAADNIKCYINIQLYFGNASVRPGCCMRSYLLSVNIYRHAAVRASSFVCYRYRIVAVALQFYITVLRIQVCPVNTQRSDV